MKMIWEEVMELLLPLQPKYLMDAMYEFDVDCDGDLFVLLVDSFTVNVSWDRGYICRLIQDGDWTAPLEEMRTDDWAQARQWVLATVAHLKEQIGESHP